MIERLARLPVEVDYGSEFRYRDPIIDSNTLTVCISQSGETRRHAGGSARSEIEGLALAGNLQRHGFHDHARS